MRQPFQSQVGTGLESDADREDVVSGEYLQSTVCIVDTKLRRACCVLHACTKRRTVDEAVLAERIVFAITRDGIGTAQE